MQVSTLMGRMETLVGPKTKKYSILTAKIVNAMKTNEIKKARVFKKNVV